MFLHRKPFYLFFISPQWPPHQFYHYYYFLVSVLGKNCFCLWFDHKSQQQLMCSFVNINLEGLLLRGSIFGKYLLIFPHCGPILILRNNWNAWFKIKIFYSNKYYPQISYLVLFDSFVCMKNEISWFYVYFGGHLGFLAAILKIGPTLIGYREIIISYMLMKTSTKFHACIRKCMICVTSRPTK